MTLNIRLSRKKSNSRGTCGDMPHKMVQQNLSSQHTCLEYSTRILVWSNGRKMCNLSSNLDTNSIELMSKRISFLLWRFWTFIATHSPLTVIALCTCAIVAEPIGTSSKWRQTDDREVSHSLSNIFLTCITDIGAQSSKTQLKATIYCLGRRSAFVANTCAT